MAPYRRNLVVGTTVLIAASLFAWMSLKFSGRTASLFGPAQFAVHFTSARADGLSEGSPVYFLGIGVGRITGVTRRADSEGVLVDAMVDRKPPLPANLRASISSSSAIGGGTVLNLDLDGDQAIGELQPEATLPAVYRGLELNVLPPQVTQTAEQIGQMSDEIRKTVAQLRESGAIGHLDDALKQISAQANRAGVLLNSAQQVIGSDKTREDIQAAIDNIRTTSAATTRISSKLDSLTDSLQEDSESLNKQLGDRLTQINAVLTNIQNITSKVDQGQGTAGMMVNDPRLYEAMVDSLHQLDATVTDLHRLVDQWEQEGLSLKVK